MPRQIQGSQTDFSYGEVDPDLKRNDGHPARKGGLRQMSNARIHNSGTLQNRSGRSALYPAPNGVRTEELTMSPGNDFKIEFGANYVRIINAAGSQAANFPGMPWTTLNTNLIRYAVLGFQIFITFGFTMRPQVITLAGAAWTIAAYTELVFGTQKRTPFYRITAQGLKLLPGAQTGSTNLFCDGAIFTAGHVGTRIRFVNRQMLVTAFVDVHNVTVTIMESLAGAQDITFSVDPGGIFSVGDEVIGSISGSKGIVTSVAAAPFHMSIQLISLNTSQVTVATFTRFGDAATVTQAFIATETISGPGGSATATVAGPLTAPTFSVALWDEEVMNDLRGYPGSCFVDNFRLGFCDFPSVPGGISWTAINSPADAYVGVNAGEGMFEPAPHKVRVYDVMGGPEGSEFIFCDHGVYYIPISVTNPLKPGSVELKLLSGDGVAHVQPRLAQEAIVYVNAGGNSPMAIIATGAYLRPFNTKGLSDYHNHLFNNIQCIACPGADTTFNERYAYILNGDGSIVCGKYKADSLAGNEPVIGWGPWSGAGTVKWIGAWGADLLFTTAYFGSTICESLNDAVYMDGAIFVNNAPFGFSSVAPAGKGPLWWIPNQSVFLMDQGTRPMGTYQIDGNGFIIPQNNGGENLLAASLIAGQIWTGAAEPFAPDAQPGADMGQRMHARAFSYFAVYILHSTGFKFQALFSGKQTRTSPPLGTPMNERRVVAYNQDDDTTIPPVQRETVETYPPQGTTFDPRVAIVWDTPGPFQLLEIAMEIGT